MQLRDYILKKNGAPLGAKSSMRNMFYQSLGMGNFTTFWKHWNPICGFYLGTRVFKPFKQFLHPYLAVIVTFLVCGLIYGAIRSLIFSKIIFVFTPLFIYLGIGMVLSKILHFDDSQLPWIGCALINLLYVGICFLLVYTLRS